MRSILLSLIVGLAASGDGFLLEEGKAQSRWSRCRPRSPERGKIQQVITTEAILFPKDQAAITPKITAPVKAFYVNRGSRGASGELLAVLENRDLAAADAGQQGRV